MSELYTERIARKEHHCDWGCGHPIRPGQRYVRGCLPPWSGVNESDHWWSVTLHGRNTPCATEGEADA